MINRVHLHRASAIIGVFLLTACAKPAIHANNSESSVIGPAHYCLGIGYSVLRKPN